MKYAFGGKKTVMMMNEGYGNINHDIEVPGMTLREWFAGMALMGMNANYHIGGNGRAPQEIAKWSFEQADAMILESENLNHEI